MTLERVDVRERSVFDARDGTAIVQQLANIAAALLDAREPSLRDRLELDRPIREPTCDGGISLDGSRQSEELVSPAQALQVERDATGLTFGHGDLGYVQRGSCAR